MDADPRVVLGPKAVTDSNRGDLMAGLGELELSPRALDLVRSLDLIREVASRSPEGPGAPPILAKSILLFSDFQRRDWLGDSGPRDPAVLDIIRQVQEAGGTFSIADLKGSDRNLSVLDLTVSPEVVARDVWVQFRATIRNSGDQDFDRVELVFSVDGREESTLVFPVHAGETVTSSPVPFRFPEAGDHAVAAEIRSDGLVLDNRRYLALRVREDAGILLVDGEPSAGLDRETLHLDVALSPDPSEARRPAEGRLTPYRPIVVGAESLDGVDPREYAVVVLANVGSFPEKFLRDLKAYVRDGGALMVFLGKNVDPLYYNASFGGEGGLLPGRLLESAGDPNSSFHLVPGDPGHPLVRYFESHREVTNIFGPIVEFKQFFRTDLIRGDPAPGAPRKPEVPEVAVPFRFSDPAGSPAVFDALCGQGRAMWVTTTADTEWNEFPKWPDFVAFLYEAIPYLVRAGEARINILVGENFRQVFEAADYSPNPVLLPPGSTVGIAKAMTKIEGENRFVLTHEDTWIPGVYELRLGRPGGEPGGERRRSFAVNVDPREGDLRPILPDDLRTHFPVLNARIFDVARRKRDAGRDKAARRGVDLSPTFLWAALGMLLLETMLAQWLGRRAR
jgi:hypothetical protein